MRRAASCPWAAVLALLVAAGCEARVLESDAGGAASQADAAPDAGRADGGAADAGPSGVGALSGVCGELDDELVSPMPFLFAAAIDLPAGFDPATQAARLSEGAQEILRDGTAGGSSVESEAFAYELLFRCDGAALLKTETELLYDDPGGTKTDFLVVFGSTRVGVSVTRAVGFPPSDPYPVSRAAALLDDKLGDVLASSENISAADAWQKQILVVVAYGPMHGASVAAAWDALPAATRADTILYVLVTDGDDAFLY